VNYDAWKFWFEVGQFMIVSALSVFLWISRRDQVSSKKLQALGDKMTESVAALKQECAASEKDVDKRLDGVSDRLTAVETKCRAANHPEILKRLNIISGRMTKVEAAVKNAPGHNDLAQAYERINAVAAEVSDMAGGVRALRGSVDMILDHLMNKGEK